MAVLILVSKWAQLLCQLPIAKSSLSDKLTHYGFESALSNLGPHFTLKGWHNIYSKYTKHDDDHREFSGMKHRWKSDLLKIFLLSILLTSYFYSAFESKNVEIKVLYGTWAK